MRKLLAAVAGAIDAREVMLFAGLGLLGYGLWPIYQPLSFIVPGAVLAGVAIFGIRG